MARNQRNFNNGKIKRNESSEGSKRLPASEVMKQVIQNKGHNLPLNRARIMVEDDYISKLREEMNSLLPWERLEYLKEEKGAIQNLINDNSPLTEEEKRDLLVTATKSGLPEDKIRTALSFSEKNPSRVRRLAYAEVLAGFRRLEKEAKKAVKENEEQLEKSKKEISKATVEDKSIFHRFHLTVKRGLKQERKIKRERNKKLFEEKNEKVKRKLSQEEFERLTNEKNRLEARLSEIQSEIIPDKEYKRMLESNKEDVKIMQGIVDRNKKTSEKIKKLRKIFDSGFLSRGNAKFSKNRDLVKKNAADFEAKQEELRAKKKELEKKIQRINEELK